jgi:hypothetical protein
MPAGKRRPKVNLPYLIRDRAYMRQEADSDTLTIELATPLQNYSAIDDGKFVAGPANDDVVVLDFDPETGQPEQPMKFVPQGIGKSISCYEIGYSDLGPDSEPEEFETQSFIQISTFATVLKILNFFESDDILGRKVRWGFAADKLAIIPRAGEAKNAFYDRDNHNLQFYYHTAKKGHRIYTALSHDIVVHEATHAILDGIAPDLFNSILPESLALHEAIADISAITQTLLNEMVLFSYDALTGGVDQDQYSTLTNIAEEFGSDLRVSEDKNYLRRMKNDFCLETMRNKKVAKSLIVKEDDPHQLSQVLAGSLYAVIEHRMKITVRSSNGMFTTLDAVFIPAARRVARIIFRALDYMPPGEVSFIDYGRAFVMAATTTYKQPQKEVKWLKEEYLRRGIIEKESDLDSMVDDSLLKVSRAKLNKLVKDNDAAIEFIELNRELFQIPDGVDFVVLPRFQAHKKIGSRKQNELFIKVSWEEMEKHDIGKKFTQTWAVRKGTTLVIDLDSNKINRLTTISNSTLTAQRDRMLKKLNKQKRLAIKQPDLDKNNKQHANHILVEAKQKVMRVQGGMRLLHIVAT